MAGSGHSAAFIVLVAFGLSCAATPNETCLTTEGIVQGLRISHSPRGDFPKCVVTLAMNDNRIVDVATPMSDMPENGTRRLAERCTKKVWGRETATRRFKDIIS